MLTAALSPGWVGQGSKLELTPSSSLLSLLSVC